MRLPQPRPLVPALPFAAFADVGLLAVFFFALSTGFTPDRDAVTLPVADGVYQAPAGAACLVVQRRVAASGETLSWRFADGRGTVTDLPGPEAIFFEASRIVEVEPERTFLLRIDAGVRYAVVDELLEMLRKAGVRNVVFDARPRGTGGGS